jgi:hypothetical protein
MHGLKLVVLLLLGHFNIVLPLKVDPKLRTGAKEAREAKRGVRSDCTLAINNFANTVAGTCSSFARRYLLRLKGLRNSSSRTSPGCTNESLSFILVVLLDVLLAFSLAHFREDFMRQFW